MLAALTTAQIAGLATAAIAALTTNQLESLATADIAALTTTQIAAMTSEQVPAFTTSQVNALSALQVEKFVSNTYFTTTQIPYLKLGTPLVLDLNGDGVKTLGYSSGVKFDLFANGQTVNTGWVSSSDGLLVMDRNHDGTINSGAELFGSASTLSDGRKATDGYAALKELDTNHDGRVDASDAGFANLQVWVDSNSDGVSQTEELKTLSSLAIDSISTTAQTGVAKDNGNLLGLTSTYQTTDGQSHAAADVWFVADKDADEARQSTVGKSSTLTSRVSEIALAISSFGEDQSNANWPTATSETDTTTIARVNVSEIAQTLGQYVYVKPNASTSVLMTAPSLSVQTVDFAVRQQLQTLADKG